MSKCNCRTLPCSCGDTGLTTPAPCDTDSLACPGGDPCEETFSEDCIRYTGDTIVDLGILNGEWLSVTIQRLVLNFTNPGCIDPTSTCLSVLGLHSTTITSSAISLKWLMSTTATQYQIEYSIDNSTWLLGSVIPLVTGATSYSGTISSLLPNTNYYFRVNATCSVGNCYSVTILVKTKLI